MTTSSHDVLTYVQKLETAGLSHGQAIAIAGGLGDLMEQRLERLVTQTHFDSELASINRRLDTLEKTLRKLENVPADLRLHTWMLALITLVIVVPTLQDWFTL